MEYKRIDKRIARKLYNQGEPVLIIPHKCSPLAAWLTGMTIENTGRTFEALVNEFIYYNCCNELGKYPAFYKEVQQ